MENLDKLQSTYDSQKTSSSSLSSESMMTSAKSAKKKLKIEQIITIVVLGITLIAIALFFSFIGRFGDWTLITGLALMFFSLLIRIGMEYRSRIDLGSIQLFLPSLEYLEKVKSYYKSRLRVQRTFTPLIYITYGIGIVLFLIGLEPNISTGFFYYCLVTGVGFWFVFIWVLRKSYRKERALLKELSAGNDSIGL